MKTAKEIIRRLRELEPELKSRGVKHCALFGSYARGEARADSDVDVLVELDETARLSLTQFISIAHVIEDQVQAEIDLVKAAGLKPDLKKRIAADRIDAF